MDNDPRNDDPRQKLDHRVTDQGVFDPPEPDEPLPEGLLRERKGPLNKDSGRRDPLPDISEADEVGSGKERGRN